ncbi:unnamed protein product [Ectocarpus sp. 13 AM-2016]
MDALFNSLPCFDDCLRIAGNAVTFLGDTFVQWRRAEGSTRTVSLNEATYNKRELNILEDSERTSALSNKHPKARPRRVREQREQIPRFARAKKMRVSAGCSIENGGAGEPAREISQTYRV